MEAKKLIELINNCADYTARLYSGRGMYGKECIGVSVEDNYTFISDLLAYARYNDIEVLDQLIDLIAKTSEDSLGLNTILYWRSIQWPMMDKESQDEL